jgi:hypothetical protein
LGGLEVRTARSFASIELGRIKDVESPAAANNHIEASFYHFIFRSLRKTWAFAPGIKGLPETPIQGVAVRCDIQRFEGRVARMAADFWQWNDILRKMEKLFSRTGSPV